MAQDKKDFIETILTWFRSPQVGNDEEIDRAFLSDAYDSIAYPHWISVEDDGNPIDTGWYIFTTGKIVDVGYYLGGNEWRDVHPTHWMPKPEAPTVAKNATVKKGGEE